MKVVFTAAEMAAADGFAINELGIPGVILMENAGRGIADIAREMLGEPVDKQVHIYCGSGNNGGDGYVVARHLANHGAHVRVFVLAAKEKIVGDAKINLDILPALEIDAEFISVLPKVEKSDLIVDAMLGTGVKGGLKGLYAETANAINDWACPVLAVDIPTGVNADNGCVSGPAVKATVTATMAAHKRGLLFSPGREYVGDLRIVDISMPPVVVEQRHSKVVLTDAEFIKSILPVRTPDAYKNKVGTVQVVAGSIGFTGAALLASETVLRGGSGLCYLSIPKSLNTIFESRSAEVITLPLDDDNTGRLVEKHLDQILEAATERDAVAVGPGLGQQPDTGELVAGLLQELNKPLVLDADGLNHCIGRTEIVSNYKGELVITPHPGEFARLTSLSMRDISENRIDLAREYAKKWNCHLVLKGGPTVVAAPGGRVYINSTGNAGMATAGSGDVLTGLVAALLGQGLSAEEAAVAAVFVHGLAGDLASQTYGQMGMVAGDILKNIPAAFKILDGAHD